MKFDVERAMPPNIISRLIVRRSEEIRDDSELWRKGAILYFAEGNAIACIIEEDRSIIVYVKGENGTEYITCLRDTLQDIFNSYRSVEPNLLYEVQITPIEKIENTTPLMLSEQTIKSHVIAERGYP